MHMATRMIVVAAVVAAVVVEMFAGVVVVQVNRRPKSRFRRHWPNAAAVLPLATAPLATPASVWVEARKELSASASSSAALLAEASALLNSRTASRTHDAAAVAPLMRATVAAPMPAQA